MVRSAPAATSVRPSGVNATPVTVPCAAIRAPVAAGRAGSVRSNRCTALPAPAASRRPSGDSATVSTAPSSTGGVSARRCQPRSDRAQIWAVGSLPALVTSSPRPEFPATAWVVPGGPGRRAGVGEPVASIRVARASAVGAIR